MEYKFTKSGKKVVVIGKLNSTQWIVQEIFVASGQEFPSGYNFIETQLLDAPDETYLSKVTRDLENRKNSLTAESVHQKGASMTRKVKIIEGELHWGEDFSPRIICPMDFSQRCCIGCAWFSIEDDMISKYGEPGVYAPFAYCKDHRIGEIVE